MKATKKLRIIGVSVEIRTGTPEYKTETKSLKRTCSVPHLVSFPLPDLYIYPKRPYLGTSVVDCRWKSFSKEKFPLEVRQSFNVYF
jgi:hypothetical protein